MMRLATSTKPPKIGGGGTRPPRTSRSRWLSWGRLRIVLVLLLLAGIGLFAAVPMDHWVLGNGYLMTDDEAELRASVEGAIDKVLARTGDLVSEGQPLIQLRDTIQRAAYEQAVSELEARRAQLKQLHSSQELATQQRKEQIFQAEQSLALAKSQLDRMQDAASRGGGYSPKELEDARLKMDLAQSRLAELRLSRDEVEREQVAVLQQQIEAAEKNVLLRKAELEARMIAAPLQGVVYYNRFEPGEVVKPEHVLGQVFNPSRWVLKLKLPERYIARIEPGQEVQVAAAAFNPMVHGYLEAKISRVIPVITPQPTGNGIFYAEAQIRQPTRYPVQPGMTATGYIRLGRATLLQRWMDSQ